MPIMAISAFLQPSSHGADQRRSPRRALRLLTQAARDTGGDDAMLIRNMSETGLLLESGIALAIGDRLEIDLPHAGRVRAKVIWASGRMFGCQFDAPVSPATLSAVQLRGTAPVDDASTPPNERFGARLHRLRIEKGLSQADLAAAMGVSTPSISGWEKGRTHPRRSRVAALAALLGVPMPELLGMDAPDAPPEKLDALVDRSRDAIARAVGTSPDKVRIIVEL